MVISSILKLIFLLELVQRKGIKDMLRKTVNSIEYVVEVAGKFNSIRGSFEFEIKAIPTNGDPYLFKGYVSEEFIEDEIDNDKKLNYLESLLVEIADKHLPDIVKLTPNSKVGDIKWWFKEAKKELESKNV